MENRIHYSLCPVCSSPEIKDVLLARDYTVSGETFWIAECNQCRLRFTQDVPDENTIAPYYKSEQYISHTNTSRGLINRIYKSVRKKTMVRKRKIIEKVTGFKQGSLLDVGSGIGTFVHEMANNGWRATGLEPDADARMTAKELYELDLADTTKFYQLEAGNFDVITLWHVLEHIHDLPVYVKQLKNLLSEKGKLFIAVPNYTSFDAAVYKEYWAAYDVPRHLYHFSPTSMKRLMEQHGLRVVGKKPMWYDSFYISLLSSKYKNGRTNWIAAFWNGLRSNMKVLGDSEACSSVIYIIEKANS